MKKEKIPGLSKNEIALVADLEFKEKYYFTREDVQQHFKTKREMINTLYTLKKKGRIVRLNKNKYFLIPIKARTGKWIDSSYTIMHELMDGKAYYLGGWGAANYWHLTDQIPMRFDVWTTRRQGRCTILNSRFVFHRTTKENIKKQGTEVREGKLHFRIMKKEESKKWLKLHQ